jgi:hypothetical protein
VDFTAPPKSGEFDQAFMNSLYEYGYHQIVSGQTWHKMPARTGSGGEPTAEPSSQGSARMAASKRPVIAADAGRLGASFPVFLHARVGSPDGRPGRGDSDAQWGS